MGGIAGSFGGSARPAFEGGVAGTTDEPEPKRRAPFCKSSSTSVFELTMARRGRELSTEACRSGRCVLEGGGWLSRELPFVVAMRAKEEAAGRRQMAGKAQQPAARVEFARRRRVRQRQRGKTHAIATERVKRSEVVANRLGS